MARALAVGRAFPRQEELRAPPAQSVGENPKPEVAQSVFQMGMIGRRGRFVAPFGRSFARERHQFHLFSDTHRR